MVKNVEMEKSIEQVRLDVLIQASDILEDVVAELQFNESTFIDVEFEIDVVAELLRRIK